MEVIDLSVFDGQMKQEEVIIDGISVVAQTLQVHDIYNTNSYLRDLKTVGARIYLYKYSFTPEGQYLSFGMAYPELSAAST